MKKIEYRTRPCSACGKLVIDCRDADTWATFPVEAETVKQPEGFALEPADNSRMNPYAARASLFLPHLPRCTAPLRDDDGSQEREHMTGQEEEGTAPQPEAAN